MGEGASEETGSMDRAKAAAREDKAAGKETAVSRAVAEDDTALLLAAVGSFRKEAMGRLRKGSDASRMLDQEMSTRLLHLACKHDAVQCARLLLEGGHGITASPVDARDQLTRTPLQVAAEAHSARCIELLLSKNARTDLKLVDGRPLVALEIALLSRRAQVKWSLDNSIEDLLSSLQEKDLNAVRLLAEKTREVGEVAYRYAMEGRVTVLAMLLLVAEEKISAPVSVVIEGVRTKKSIYYSIVDEALSIGDAQARDSNERRKALLSEIQLLNQFGAALWRDRNIDKRSLPPLLKAAKVGDVNVTKMLLMGDVDVNEADPEGNTALHWCLSGSSSTQEPSSYCSLHSPVFVQDCVAPAEEWCQSFPGEQTWSYTLLSKNARTDLKLVDGRPLVALEIALLSRRAQVKWSLDNSIEDLLSSLQEKDLNAVRLLAEKTREVGEVAYRYAMEGRVTVLAMLLLVAEEKISAPVSVVIEGVRTKKSIYYSIVDEALSIGDAPARDSNERRKALLSEIQLLNQFGAALWRDRNIDKRSLPPLLKAAMPILKENTALHWCLSGSSSTQEPRIVWLLLKNGARVFQGNKLGLTPVHSAAAKGNYKALQLLLRSGASTKVQNLRWAIFRFKKNMLLFDDLIHLPSCDPLTLNRKQRPIDVATSQDMRFILTSANVAPWNRSSHPKKSVTNKESCKEFLDDNFVDYDSDDLNESFTGLKTSASHRDFRSSNGSAQGGKSKSHCAPKQGSKFVPRPNHWLKHDYTRKIFVGGLPPSVGADYLTEFFTAEFGPVEEAVVIGIRMGDRVQSRGFGFVKFKREEDVISAKETHHVYMLGKRVEEAVVIGIRMGDRVQSRGFGFVKFKREEDVISAKETHHVYMLGKRVEVKDAVARGSLPAEIQKTASFRHHCQEVPKVTHHLLDGELKEEHYIRKRKPLPEKCLPSWFFIFRKWLPGFLADATERLGDRYPLSSLKGDFRAICRMELDHGTLGYPKLSDFMRSLPGICRMCVVPVGSGPATHMVLLPPVSRPKYVPLLEPFSFDHDELPESVSDHQSPRYPLTTNITEDSPRNTDSQQGDTCSESNVQSHQGDECCGSNTESQQDSASTDNGSLLSEVTVSTPKPDSIESIPTGKSDLIELVPTRKPHLIDTVTTRKPDLIVIEPTRKPIVIEPVPTRKPSVIEPVPTRKPMAIEPVVPTRKPIVIEPVPTRKPIVIEPVPTRKPIVTEPLPTRKPTVIEPASLTQKIVSEPMRKTDLFESGLARRIGLIGSRPTTCSVDCPVERPAVTPSNCEADMRFSFFQSQWDRFLAPYPKSDYCIICRSYDAAMQLVPCLHKICVACMMRCNVRACMTCGTAGVMERASDQRCQLMVVCRGAEAIVRCSPCMHSIACRGCFLASVTLLKGCTTCGCMIEHFKFC
uniref:RRM domain-containing protein n=1 Tax=Oryza meridionalis TaxID=40149 RepID=A0A0E0FDC1_9ORYZ